MQFIPQFSGGNVLIKRRTFLHALGAVAAVRAVPAAITLGASVIPALPGWAGSPSKAGSMLDRLVSRIDPVLEVVNAHTNERAMVRFFTSTGYDMEAVRKLNWIWRDWRDNEAPQINPRLFWGAAVTRASAMKDGHDGVMTLLSGFRTKKTTLLLRSQGVGAAMNSKHMDAEAVDMRFAGIPADRVSGFVEWLEVGGTGYYRKSNFTHMDSGDIRQWRG